MFTLDIVTQFNNKKSQVKYSAGDFPIWRLVNEFMEWRLKIPAYQRKFRRGNDRQSKFIESMLLGLPIPSLFFARNKNDQRKKEIVDWSQRIRTLVSFLCGDENVLREHGLKRLKLTKCTILSQLKWKYFEDLPEELKNELIDWLLRINILEADIPSSVKVQIFERINTWSVALSPMEKRAWIYASDFIDFIYEDLAKDATFNRIITLPPKKEDEAVKEDLILRFLWYTETLLEDENLPWYQNIGSFFDQLCKNKMESGFNEEKYRRLFLDTFTFLDNNRREDASSFLMKTKKKKGGNWTTYYSSNAWFEAISVWVALALQLWRNIDIVTFKEWVDSEEFRKIVSSDASNNKNKLLNRILSVKRSLLWIKKEENLALLIP